MHRPTGTLDFREEAGMRGVGEPGLTSLPKKFHGLNV